MRPKIVILTLVVALGLLGIIAVLKGVMGGHAGDVGGQTPVVEASVESPPAATNDQVVQVVQVVQVNPNSSNTVAIAEQLRAAEVEKEVDQIRDLQGEADGTNNPMIISALLDKLSHPEAEVRKAVLDALKQLNDTNAVPGLQQAADLIKDPREKVAVMDAIDFIKLPEITANLTPEFATNTSYVENSKTVNRNRGTNSNPNFRNRKMGGQKNNNHQAVPPNAPADQPVPAEAPAQPQ
jgi:hypothetical protein